jgi:hypothetical protein
MASYFLDFFVADCGVLLGQLLSPQLNVIDGTVVLLGKTVESAEGVSAVFAGKS